ncbi:hypothetical protein ACFLYS_02635 [Chloroflexota bacterium]
MTVVIGIKCSEGIVMGADGAATLGAMGVRTIVQPTAKLRIIGDNGIFGFSGQVGLSQLFFDRATSVCARLRTDGAPEVCRKLRDAFLEDTRVAMQTASLARTVVGGIAAENVSNTTLIALAIQGRPELIQFDYQCQPEMTTIDLPFVSIGCGEPLADPFLAFIRSIFWEKRLPTAAEGRFAVMWALTHAIRTAPAGIGEPIQMATLEKIRGSFAARILSEDELQEHREAISKIEEHIKTFQVDQQTSDELPSPPPECP